MDNSNIGLKRPESHSNAFNFGGGTKTKGYLTGGVKNGDLLPACCQKSGQLLRFAISRHSSCCLDLRCRTKNHLYQ